MVRWQSGDCATLETWRGVTASVGSSPTLTAARGSGHVWRGGRAAIAPASKAGGARSVQRFESPPPALQETTSAAEDWQSGECSGLENRRPRAGPWVRIPHPPL